MSSITMICVMAPGIDAPKTPKEPAKLVLTRLAPSLRLGGSYSQIKL